jgi:hypothetical protein
VEHDYSTGKKPRNPTDHQAITASLDMKEELEDQDLHIRMDHHTIAAALGKKEEIDDLGQCIKNPTFHGKEMPGIQLCSHRSTHPAMSVTSITMKTMMLIWEPPALPIGFVGLRYP